MKLKGKRILLTGGSGFLGRHVHARLLSENAEVIAPTRQHVDFTSPYDTSLAFSMTCFDIVIHLAAHVGGIGANLAKPAEFFRNNMAMGLNVIHQAFRTRRVKKVVVIGSCCMYPKFAAPPFMEAHLWKGYPEETNAPYGIAKRAMLVMCQAYREQYGLNSIFLIPANLYGPGDHTDLETSHVIPALIKKFMDAKRKKSPRVSVWGSGKPTREFLYVEDAADGIVKATEAYDKPNPVNLGTGHEVSIAALAQHIKDLVGYRGRVVFDPSKPDGQPRRRLDIELARTEFDWMAKTSLDEGLKRTIESMSSEPKPLVSVPEEI